MRTNVSFSYPAEFVCCEEEPDILAVEGAQWFVALLHQIPGLQVNDDLCQEDWGVVVFVRRGSKRFWIGLSAWLDGERAWLAQVHHGSFAWLQRISRSGQTELDRLVSDLHDVPASDPAVSAITWYHESEMSKPDSNGAPRPAD